MEFLASRRFVCGMSTPGPRRPSQQLRKVMSLHYANQNVMMRSIIQTAIAVMS